MSTPPVGNIEGISFLNLFSGSGVIGIEAASRGAAPVLLVGKEPRKKPTVLKNIAFVESHIDLVVDPVERFLKTSQRSGTSYSLIRRSISRARPLPWTNRAPPPHLSPGGLARALCRSYALVRSRSPCRCILRRHFSLV